MVKEKNALALMFSHLMRFWVGRSDTVTAIKKTTYQVPFSVSNLCCLASTRTLQPARPKETGWLCFSPSQSTTRNPAAGIQVSDHGPQPLRRPATKHWVVCCMARSFATSSPCIASAIWQQLLHSSFCAVINGSETCQAAK